MRRLPSAAASEQASATMRRQNGVQPIIHHEIHETHETRTTLRGNAPALLSACHFVYFVYFVVSTATLEGNRVAPAAVGGCFGAG